MDDFNLLEMFHNLDETAEENNVTIGGYLVEYNQDGKKLIQAVGSINVFTIKDVDFQTDDYGVEQMS